MLAQRGVPRPRFDFFLACAGCSGRDVALTWTAALAHQNLLEASKAKRPAAGLVKGLRGIVRQRAKRAATRHLTVIRASSSMQLGSRYHIRTAVRVLPVRRPSTPLTTEPPPLAIPDLFGVRLSRAVDCGIGIQHVSRIGQGRTGIERDGDAKSLG